MTMPATTDGTQNSRPLPRPAPAALALACTLRRGAGSPIACETIDLGTTGMRLTTGRPLAVDETVAFELPLGEARVRGQARVVGQERPDVYVLRFDRLPAPMTQCLCDLVAQHPASRH
jgi:hypothetical protein